MWLARGAAIKVPGTGFRAGGSWSRNNVDTRHVTYILVLDWCGEHGDGSPVCRLDQLDAVQVWVIDLR